MRNKSSNFLKLEENLRDSFIVNQQVILLGENQETEPVQVKNKLLHAPLLHTPVHDHAAVPGQAGAETSGRHKSLPGWEAEGMAAS